MSDSERAELRAALSASAEKRYASATAMVEILLATVPTYRVLGDLGFLFYMNQEGLSSGKQFVIEQHHLEYVQALLLRSAAIDDHPDPYIEPEIVKLIEALVAQSRSSTMRHLPGPDATEQEIARFEVIDGITRFTQDVRGDFNTDQFQRYLKAIFATIDERFAKQHGITATALLDTLMALLARVEANLSGFQRAIARTRHAKRGGKAVSTYFRAFPQDEPVRAMILANAKSRRVPDEYMGQYLFGRAYNHLPRAFSFDRDEVRNAAPAGSDPEAALRAVGRWTVAFGELADRTAERLLVDNPVWSRPFVQLDPDRWMWPSPGTLFSGGINMFELLMEADPRLKEAYSRARANFLEAEVARLFRYHLSSARVWTSVKWRDDATSTPFEADIVAKIDGILIVVEAKSGQVNDAARRGAEASLRREIGKLMVDPAIQSARFADHVRSEGFKGSLTCSEGACDLDVADIRRVIRLTVNFETPGPLATAWPMLVKANIVPADVAHAPVVGLSDLDVLLDLLGDEATIMHYLSRRAAFERTSDFLADEHDLIAFYLQTGFNVATVEEGGSTLNIYGMSDMLRDYYLRVPGRERPKPPKPDRSPLWNGWITEVSRRKPEQWTTMAHMLLDVDPDTQRRVGGEAMQKLAEVRAVRKAQAFRAVLLPTGPSHRRGAVVVLAYRGLPKDEVEALVRDLFDKASSEVGTERVLVIGMDVANPRPYSFIALSEAEEDAVS